MLGGGLGWGRVGRGEGLGGGIMTSIRRAHMHKLLAFTAFLIILRGCGTFHHDPLLFRFVTAHP